MKHNLPQPEPDDEQFTNEQLRADLAPFPKYRQVKMEADIAYLELMLKLPCTQLNPRLLEDLENE
jgi:hypothetical protein